MNLNKVVIVGRVTAAPELRRTPGGQSVTTMSVATNRTWTDKAGARQEETEFHTVVVWGRQAEVAAQFLTKGSTVMIEGRLKTRSWQDKQGSTHKSTEIISERLQLGPRPMGAGAAPQGGNRQPAAEVESKDVPVAEDIPIINLDEEPAGDIKPEDLPF